MPIPIEEGSYGDGVARYRLRKVEPWGWMMWTHDGALWKESYSFDLGPITQADIDVGNHYTSTSPNSHFTQMRTVSLPTLEGRVSLRNYTATRVHRGRSSTRMIADRPDYLDLLNREFGIRLDVAYSALRPLRSVADVVE